MSDGTQVVEVSKSRSRINENQTNPNLPQVEIIENYQDVVKAHQEQRLIDKEEKRAERKEQKRRANETPVPIESNSELSLPLSAQAVLPLPQSLLQPIPFKNIEQSGLLQHRVLPEQWATENTRESATWLKDFLIKHRVVPSTMAINDVFFRKPDGSIIPGLQFRDQSGSAHSRAFQMYRNSLVVCQFAVYNDPSFKDFRKTPPLLMGDLINSGSAQAMSPLSNFNARKVFNHLTHDLGIRGTDWIDTNKYNTARRDAVFIDNKEQAQEAANAFSLFRATPNSVGIILR